MMLRKVPTGEHLHSEIDPESRAKQARAPRSQPPEGTGDTDHGHTASSTAPCRLSRRAGEASRASSSSAVGEEPALPKQGSHAPTEGPPQPGSPAEGAEPGRRDRHPARHVQCGTPSGSWAGLTTPSSLPHGGAPPALCLIPRTTGPTRLPISEAAVVLPASPRVPSARDLDFRVITEYSNGATHAGVEKESREVSF